MPHFFVYCKHFSKLFINFAAVVELADARDSKSRDGDIVWVRPPPAAPMKLEQLVFSGCSFFTLFY